MDRDPIFQRDDPQVAAAKLRASGPKSISVVLLGSELVTSPVLAQSETERLVRERQWCVALPSELEWEKAARGGLPDAVFSWGDMPDPDRANYDDSGIGATSAVGCFPVNGFGLHDMIGNVGEWTRSHYASYPYRGDDGRENLKASDLDFIVLRGGSWSGFRGGARCTFRVGTRPGDRYFGVGFRVVVRSAPVP